MKKYSILISAFLVFSELLGQLPFQAATNTLTVHFLDVGQGDSVLIQTAMGRLKMNRL